MTERKVSYATYFEAEQVERLKALSRKTGVPQSVYMREALDKVLEKHEADAKKRGAGR